MSIFRDDYYKSYNVDRKYRNDLPIIIIDDNKKEIVVNVDKEIRILRLQNVLDNTSNREWCFWAESTCQTYANLLQSTIVGTGLRVQCPTNQKAEEVVHTFNRKVNSSGTSMEDLIGYVLIDNSIHGFSTWRIQKLLEEPYIDLGRLDAGNILPLNHPQQSWMKFIYRATIDEAAPRTKKEFLSPNYSPPYDPTSNVLYNQGREYEWHIPLSSTLHFNLVSRPPMSSAMQYVLFKRWLLWFMRKSAEKSWMPIIVVTLGNERVNFFGELTPQEQEQVLRNAASRVAKLASFGVIAVKDGEEIKVLEDKTISQARSQFVDQIKLLDKEIIFSMGGAFGMADVDQTEIGTQRQAENILVRNVQALRARIGNRLEQLYIGILLPLYGIHLKPGELTMDWSHVKEDRNLDIVQMATTVFEHGGCSKEEYRKQIKPIWEWINPSDTEQADKDFEKYNEAIKKAKDMFGERAGSTTNEMNKKVQPTRPSEQKKGAEQKRE